MIEAMPQAMMGLGSSNGHGYSAGREFLSIQKVFNKTGSINRAARAGAEDFVGFKKEFADLSTILSFSYEVKNGRWMNNGRTLDEINDPEELGGDRILRVLAAEKTMGQDPDITQAAVISEDLGFGRSYLYLFSKDRDNPNGISALAIEYQGSQETLRNFVQNLWSRSGAGGEDVRKPDFAKPIFFTKSTSVGVRDVFDLVQKSLQKEVGADNTRSYLSRFARDVVDVPSVLARQEIEIENLTRKYQEQMLKDTDIVSGIASIVAGSVAISAKWQETINERSKFSTVPPPDFQFRSSRRVSAEPLVPKSFLVTPAGGSPGMTEGAKLVSSPDPVFYVPAVLFFIRTSEISREDQPADDNETSQPQLESPDVRLILFANILAMITNKAQAMDFQADQELNSYTETDLAQHEGFISTAQDKQPSVKVENSPDISRATEVIFEIAMMDIVASAQPKEDSWISFFDELDDTGILTGEINKTVEILAVLLNGSENMFPHSENPQPFEVKKDSEKVQTLILRVVEGFLQEQKLRQTENNNPDFQEKLMRLSFWSEILTDEKTPASVKKIIAALIYLEIKEYGFIRTELSDSDELMRRLSMISPEKFFSGEMYLPGQLSAVLIPHLEKMMWIWHDLSRLFFIIFCLFVSVQKLESCNKSPSGGGKYSWEKLLGLLKTRNMLRGSARNKKINKKKKFTVIYQYSRLPLNTSNSNYEFQTVMTS